jgi:hypothetical protein
LIGSPGLRETLVSRLGTDLIANPQLGDALVRQIDELLAGVEQADATKPVPPDQGLAQLVGIGPQAAAKLGETRLPHGVVPYDETVTSERIVAVGDLYYIYQHERLGVFRVVQKLQELFRAGVVRLSAGPGAYGLYRFDRRDVLRYTLRDRRAAYARVLGYGNTPVPAGARRNAEYHRLFSHFVDQVTLFWRDKRISDVIRERSYDPSFGSIAVVRRAGLDLRNNLKFASFGHLNVLRVEVMQVLDEAFRILETDDIKRLFGADNAWDVVEEVLIRYFNQRLVTSPRQRMAITGREMLRWLAQPHILQTARAQFETLLLQIAEHADEWQMSASALGLTPARTGSRRVLPFEGRAPLNVVPPAADRAPRQGPRRPAPAGGARRPVDSLNGGRPR